MTDSMQWIFTAPIECAMRRKPLSAGSFARQPIPCAVAFTLRLEVGVDPGNPPNTGRVVACVIQQPDLDSLQHLRSVEDSDG